MGNIFRLTHTLLVFSLYSEFLRKKITNCIFASFFYMQIGNFDNIEALFEVEGPRTIGLIFRAPKALSARFCVPAEMPKETTRAA